jgi:ABC-2 type transport system permease protein
VNPALTLATTRRILLQLRHDPRTVVMLILVPTLLMVLLRYVFNSTLVFSHVAPALLGVFPFLIMFLIASITTLRERTTATLERLMTLPIGRLDLLFGYALAFGSIAVVQVSLAAGVSLWWLGLDLAGSIVMLLVIAVLDALLGMALGLFVSAFARTEFQAIQFMPVFVLPQILLCGLFVPRGQMSGWLQGVSDVLPLTYAVQALMQVGRYTAATATMWRDVVVVAGAAVVALVLAAATLRRRTP